MSVSALRGSAAAAGGATTGESDHVRGDEPRGATPLARRDADDVARPGVGRDELDVSVLVPAKDEAENLPLFMEQARDAFEGSPLRYEVVVVDDGSDDDTWAVLQGLRERYPFLRVARHRKRRGIADALRTGYLVSRGRVLVFYPADLQYKPEDIPRLVAPIIAGESDMVTGHKQGIYEKAFVSRIYNRLSRTLFDVPVRDLNSVKAYRREVMDVLPVRPDWHRYMIVVAAASGFSVSEIPVPLYPRHAGRSKFGIGRIPVGVLDMLSVWFELRFAKKPLLLFGLLGFALLAVGALAFLVALARLWISGVGVRWVWMIIQTCLILGSIFFVGGLVGEMIASQRSELRELRRRLAERDSTWSDREPG
ncbi:MAG TPA: glycosyltransferase family 2 protein [Gemmatimonadaceae bacterium]|nr:glycosyltransferase family 2 protein [Gemmatimonadaceae bacterium]